MNTPERLRCDLVFHFMTTLFAIAWGSKILTIRSNALFGSKAAMAKEKTPSRSYLKSSKSLTKVYKKWS